MTLLTLLAQSVRVEKEFVKGKTLEEQFKDKVQPRHVANAVLKLCGYPTVSNYMGTESLWPSTNPIYAAIKNCNIEIEFICKPFVETSTTFKHEGAETGAAKTGVYDIRWFENQYASQRGDYQPGLVQDFEDWLKQRYPATIGAFPYLMAAFEQDVVASGATASGNALDAWLNKELPAQFNVFSYIRKVSYYGSLSKYVTRPYLVRADGRVDTCSQQGSVVTVGGPRQVIHGQIRIKLDLPDDIFVKIHNDKRGGPMFATIGDGGLLWIEETE